MRYYLCLSAIVFAGLVGCEKPFDKPEYAEIKPNETAYVLRLEGDNKSDEGQVKFGSIEYLDAHKVAAKRIQVTHRWDQQGKGSADGAWIPDMVVVKVDRSPITRVWTKDETTGTSAKNEAVEVESKDSVNFSIGWSCTAMIAEEDTSKFLYLYPNDSLSTAMDREILGRIQRECQLVVSKYILDEARGKKDEIQQAVEASLKDFKQSRGITITNVALYGGLSYSNPQIQQAIDEAAKSANLKVIEAAKLDAQSKTNERLVLEAQGKASAAKQEADGLAAAKLAMAEAEAKSITIVNKALESANGNPLVLQFKVLEVQKAQLEKWDGKYPLWYLGGNSGATPPGLMIQVPAQGGPVTK